MQAHNPQRQFIKLEMVRLGFRTRKAYKKYVKKLCASAKITKINLTN